MLYNILLVDDDENILSGFKRNLRTKFNVTISNDPTEALKLIKNSPPFAVIVSDYKMPQMNGVDFLAKVNEIKPDSVRLLLTGYADVNTAIDAVNEGHVFRILTKPCNNENLLKNIYAAVEQYRLIVAERELLDKTLKGSIKVLIDVLSVVSPDAFNQATKFKNIAKKIAKRLKIRRLWEIEIAALLSQVGCVAVPPEIMKKRSNGSELNDDEYNLFIGHPDIGKSLIQRIPRLENISDAISYQFKRYDGVDAPSDFKIGDNIPLVGRILKVVNDFDNYVKSGLTRHNALEIMKADQGSYDMQVLSALEAEISGLEEDLVIRYVNVTQLEPGMLLAEDIVDANNLVLIVKDNEVTEVLLAKIQNYAKVRNISEPIKILQAKNN